MHKCPICWEELNSDKYRTNCCSNYFHSHCLNIWLKISRFCPICREKVPDFDWNIFMYFLILYPYAYSYMLFFNEIFLEKKGENIQKQIICVYISSIIVCASIYESYKTGGIKLIKTLVPKFLIGYLIIYFFNDVRLHDLVKFYLYLRY